MSNPNILRPKPCPPKKPIVLDDDDWETDPDFVNDVGEKEGRWGAKTVEGSGRQAHIDIGQLRDEVLKSDGIIKQKHFDDMPKSSEGYGGKFGIQSDRVDKSAESWAYHEKVAGHASQKDYKHGFGGEFGVQRDRVDKSAEDWSYKQKVDGHTSQKDYKYGFGGEFGVESDRVDKSAEDWSYKQNVDGHASQKDYKHGFGGEFGVQTDRQDKSAAGWDSHDKLQSHESQVDYKHGFGGQFGVQKDRQDKSALGWDSNEKVQSHESQVDYKHGFGGQFGVQKDRQDKSALGWDSNEKVQSHESQVDYKQGFGGQFGVQKDRQDKSAVGWEKQTQPEQHESQTDYKKGFNVREGNGLSGLKAQFEKFQLGNDESKAEKPKLSKIQQEIMDLKKNNPVQISESAETPNANIITPVHNAITERTPEFVPTQEDISLTNYKQDSNVPISPKKEIEHTEHNDSHHTDSQITTDSYHSDSKHNNSQITKDSYHNDSKHANSLQDSINANEEYIREEAQSKIEEHHVPSTEIKTEKHHSEQPIQDLGLTAYALFDYEKQDDDELNFNADDLITNIEQIDIGWWRGSNCGFNGLFPANYVQLNQ
uniref:SH3 domain-containing protein n=1 Tax=Rhabditophanes sp. KR3021 TaxID=114890 RepID=A0AC35UAE4_9BILA